MRHAFIYDPALARIRVTVCSRTRVVGARADNRANCTQTTFNLSNYRCAPSICNNRNRVKQIQYRVRALAGNNAVMQHARIEHVKTRTRTWLCVIFLAKRFRREMRAKHDVHALVHINFLAGDGG